MTYRTQINYTVYRHSPVFIVFMFDQSKHFNIRFIQLQQKLDISVHIRDFL